ncbi:DsbA family oxidoreductase [Burkholderia glumae]|uniref:DsbA family oxidoreductase n=1 Tax=Burkholderia glumae TaxID=337 RepID=UPI00214FB8AC|nr:DsbA family oxidoreductase [Burkholderia glumae]
MSQPLTIDFVSDVACPWCAVGLSSLLIALERVGDAADVQIRMHPFELNPNMGPEGESIVEHIGKKYGRTPEQVAEAQAMLRERGASVGFTFGQREAIHNTFDAHRLLHWAGLEGRQLPLKLELLRACHGEGKRTDDPELLAAAAQAAGLDAERAREVLASGAYAGEVRAAEREAQALGISSVPSVIFNERYLVTGGQPAEAFERAIRQILAEAAEPTAGPMA